MFFLVLCSIHLYSEQYVKLFNMPSYIFRFLHHDTALCITALSFFATLKSMKTKALVYLTARPLKFTQILNCKCSNFYLSLSSVVVELIGKGECRNSTPAQCQIGVNQIFSSQVTLKSFSYD